MTAPRLGVLPVAADLPTEVRALLPPGHAIVGEDRAGDRSVIHLLIEGPDMPEFKREDPATVLLMILRLEAGPPRRRFARWEHLPAKEWELPADTVLHGSPLRED